MYRQIYRSPHGSEMDKYTISKLDRLFWGIFTRDQFFFNMDFGRKLSISNWLRMAMGSCSSFPLSTLLSYLLTLPETNIHGTWKWKMDG